MKREAVKYTDRQVIAPHWKHHSFISFFPPTELHVYVWAEAQIQLTVFFFILYASFPLFNH